jgi:hypothetical protein
MKHAAQLEFPAPTPRHPFYVAPGDWARPGLVDAGFVERSVAVLRDMPDAERQLSEAMAETLEGIRAIDLVYGTEPNAWAAATREGLWLKHFTAETILRRLKAAAKCNEAGQ